MADSPLRMDRDSTGKPLRGFDFDFEMTAVALYVDDGVGGVQLWDGNMEVLGDIYVSVDEVEDLLQPAPVARSNPSFVLSYTGNLLTQIDMTVQGTTYRRTLSYTANKLTGVSVWVTL